MQKFLLDAYTWKSFMTAVTNDESYLLKNPISKPIRAFVGGKERGTLIGGNLSLIISSLVTPYEIDTENKILFLEDIDENPLRIDRMLTQLKLAKKFEHVRGILLGSWKNCEGNIKGTTLQTVFEEKFSTFHVPVLMDLACGHSLPTMSLPLGKTIEIDADEKIIKVL